MARHAAGVAVIATRDAGGYRGLTVTTLTGVSLEPPLVLVCLDRLSQTRELVVAESEFTASLLNRDQDFLADRFAARAPQVDASWRDVSHRLGRNRLPIIEGATAWLECRLTEVHPAGDHDILLAAVTDAGLGRGDPLVLWDRTFWTVA